MRKVLPFLLLCCLAIAPTPLAAAHAESPTISHIQSVAAVHPSHYRGWSQRVGNVLIARVMSYQGPSKECFPGLVAYDLDSRQLLWMINDPCPRLNVSPFVNQAVDGNLVFWAYVKGARKPRLYLADLKTGRSHAIAPTVAEKIEKETEQRSPLWSTPLTVPAADGHRIFLGTYTHARAVSVETGKLIWEVELPWPPGPASCRPYPYFNQTVFFYSELGRVLAIDSYEGKILWSRDLLGIDAKPDEPLGENVEGPSTSTMIGIGGDRLFFHAGDVVYALDPDTGQTLWKTQVCGSRRTVPYPPVVWDSAVVVVVRDGWADQLKCLDMKTGEVLWTWELGQIAKEVAGEGKPEPTRNQVSSNLLVMDGQLLFCTLDGMLRALGNDREGEHWQIRLRPQSSPYADFAAILYRVDSQVVAFDGATAWWIDLPLTTAPSAGASGE
ncbi:MAG: PQQ-binding-like beta-propeller repeat protein [Armatimonadetes bacterium]|nr:PQQ-binding-like beta-propeller repeat protein [Armatimonadota bacterium]